MTIGDIIDHYDINNFTDRVYITINGEGDLLNDVIIKEIKHEASSDILELPKNIKDIKINAFYVSSVCDVMIDIEHLKYFDFPIHIIDFIMYISKEDYKIVKDWESGSSSDTSD